MTAAAGVGYPKTINGMEKLKQNHPAHPIEKDDELFAPKKRIETFETSDFLKMPEGGRKCTDGKDDGKLDLFGKLIVMEKACADGFKRIFSGNR